MTEIFTSGAGLPASTLQENSASSPSFTTSFSGLTLITGFTANMLVKRDSDILFTLSHHLSRGQTVKMVVIFICVTQESDLPPSLWRQVEES